MEKLYLDITNKCNLNCKHCLNSASSIGKTQLGVSTINKIIQQAKLLHVKKIKLGGGEPLIHPDIIEILRLLGDNNYLISLTTNGLLLNNELIEKLKEFNVSLSLSLETSKSTHEALRGKNTYDKTLEIASTLASNKIDFWIESMLLPNNLEEFESQIKLVEALGVKLKVRRIKYLGRATEDMILCSTGKEYDVFVNSINNAKCKVNIEKLVGLKYDEKIQLHEEKCQAGRENFHINFDGSISPCIFLGSTFISGNANHDNIFEIVKNGIGFKKIKSLELNNCMGCPAIKNFCNTNINMNDPLINYGDWDA